jgi:hypothetical protein
VFIGTPPSRLLICTGIAMPSLESNGQVDGQEVTIDLREKSNVPMPPFTATVGLASIYNTDSDLLFATDDVRIVTGADLELLLICNIAAMGDTSILHRFSYQATVLLPVDNGTIAGNIRWDPHMMTAIPGMERDLFLIKALKPGSDPVGHTLGQPARQGNLMGISYEILDLPLGEALTVSVDPKPGAFSVHMPGTFNFEQVSGPRVISLSAAHLLEKPVDFEARQSVGPS